MTLTALAGDDAPTPLVMNFKVTSFTVGTLQQATAATFVTAQLIPAQLIIA